MDLALEGSGSVESRKKQPQEMVYFSFGGEFLGFTGNSLYFLLQQKERGKT